MSCCGQHRDRTGKSLPNADVPYAIAPAEPCALCADKHLSTAYALAGEAGYADTIEYRKRICGELVLATWHIWRIDYGLAEKLRDARHLAQRNRLAAIDWRPILAAMDARVTAEEKKEAEADK